MPQDFTHAPIGYKTAQGKSLKDFKSPPLDFSLPIHALLDWHLEHSPNAKYAVLTPYIAGAGTGVGEEEGKVLESVTYRECEFCYDVPSDEELK